MEIFELWTHVLEEIKIKNPAIVPLIRQRECNTPTGAYYVYGNSTQPTYFLKEAVF